MRNRNYGLAAAWVALSAFGAEAQPVDRETVFRVSRALDRAVERVARGTSSWTLGPGRAQGIALPGYGVVFVLSPRVLPGYGDAKVRRLLRRKPAPGARTTREVDEATLAAIEARLAEHNAEMAQADRALAQAMAQLERAMRSRAEGATAPVAAAAPLPTQAPLPPKPPRTPDTPTAPQPPAPPQPPAAPEPLEDFLVTVPPPWLSWFGEGEGKSETRSPEAVLAEVRTTVTNVLTAEAAGLGFVKPDEHVVVAVDFVGEGLLYSARTRPTRSLVIRAKKKDLQERANGRITPEELARRTEVVEN